MDYEKHYLEHGKTVIVGLDEAGYGAWAGPVAAGAACLPLGRADLMDVLRGVKDSKQMTPLQRDAAYDAIQTVALGWGVGAATPDEIGEHGLSAALSLAYSRAYNACVGMLGDKAVEVVLIDGKTAWRTFEDDALDIERIAKGDSLSLSIAAASVLAKVWRDRELKKLGETHPRYGFEKHKGYGTKAHITALEQFGVLHGVHRTTYRPVAALLR
jgi:ribonuclease HII